MALRSYQDPFEDYKNRLAKRLARKEAQQSGTDANKQEEKESDGVNWFGVKLGSTNTSLGNAKTTGVGKYLSLKRPLESTPRLAVGDSDDDPKKKRRTGFGSFDSW